MFILASLAAGLALGLLTGGSLRALAGLRIRHSGLLLCGLLLQVIAFSDLLAELPGRTTLVVPSHYLSYALVLLALVLNLGLHPLRLLLLGTLTNFVAIVANGGFMPASPEALRAAGMTRQLERIAARGADHNSQLLDAQTRLPFLGDIFAIPAGWPLANVFSVGDVLICLAATWLIVATMHGYNGGAVVLSTWAREQV